MKDAVKVFKALSDPTRLRILMLLLQRDLCVCELVYILKMEQSRISHQLRILRDADLVKDIRDGRWTNYRVTEKAKKTLHVVFDKMLRDNASDSDEFEKDRKNMRICIEENFRMKKMKLK